MMEGSGDWGEFSEWLERIEQCILSENRRAEATETDVCLLSGFAGLQRIIQRWLEEWECAPKTTWLQELNVRGQEFPMEPDLEEAMVSSTLWKLIWALADMQVYLINTDHLDDRALYHVLVHDFLIREIPHRVSAFPEESGYLIDVVAADGCDEPIDWLHYYANNRERMEWAKQNPGKPLPISVPAPYGRDHLLPGMSFRDGLQP